MVSESSDSNANEQFARLYATHHLDLLRYVLTLVPDMSQAEDIVQETARVLWRKAADYDPDRPFLPWARKAAWLEVLKHRRTYARRRELLFSDTLLETLAEERVVNEDALQMRREALEKCLQRLDPKSRGILLDRFGEKRSLVEIAEREGRTANALYVAMHRIRQRLLECVRRSIQSEGQAS